MAISFVRVDDRVIHGQVLTQWTRIYPCDGIIVANDYLANNKQIGKVYKNAAPANVRVLIFTIEKAISKMEEAKQSAKNYYLITKSVVDLLALAEAGVDFGENVIFGPSSYREDKITIGHNQSLTKEEILACEKLHQKGIRIDFKLTPDKSGNKWSELRNHSELTPILQG